MNWQQVGSIVPNQMQALADVAALRAEVLALKADLANAQRAHADLAGSLDAAVARAIAALPRPKDVASVDPTEVEAMVAGSVARAIAALPAQPDVKPLIAEEVHRAVSVLPKPKDGEPGRSVDESQVDALISERIKAALTEWPKPQDGKSLTVEDVAPMIASEVAKAMAAVPVPKDGTNGRDGADMVGALIDREGHLVVTLSDGTAKNVGLVIGRDGQSVDMAEVARTIKEQIDAWPRPKDGANGLDGLGFDDLEVLHDGERSFTFKFQQGDRVKEFSFVLPVLIYRGIYDPTKEYARGDVTTWDGGMWHANEPTRRKPDQPGSKAWTLCVRRGKEGKSGLKGEKGDPGSRGEQGPPGPRVY